MDLYEYQAKHLFGKHNVPVTAGEVCSTPDAAHEATRKIGSAVVVKAQVKVGGRGKAGGVKLATDPKDAKAKATDILGMDIKGHTVKRVWIEAASDIKKEYYASVTFDRSAKKPLVMLSAMGGMDIEAVAEEHPEALARLHVDPLIGFQPHHGRWLVYHAGIDEPAQKGVLDALMKSYEAFIGLEATLIEINPLIWTADDRVVALDAKVSIDNNALYRHPDLAELQESVTDDPQERMAQERGVTYVKLDGDVGIMGNGAGIVMSSLDVVALAGGKPANFLDAGGGSNAEAVATALEVLLSDPKVKSLMINIFGGITRCDQVAEGLLTALDTLGATLPIVVRLDGTAAPEGRAIIAERAPANVVVEPTMLSAAKRAVELAKEAS